MINEEKYQSLIDTLNGLNHEKCIVFSNTKLKVDELVW